MKSLLPPKEDPKMKSKSNNKVKNKHKKMQFMPHPNEKFMNALKKGMK
jgi:hypothetical protein